MKLAWITFSLVMLLLVGYGFWHKRTIRHEELASDQPQSYSEVSANGGLAASGKNIFSNKKKGSFGQYTGSLPRTVVADSITQYGLRLIGAPYLPAGITCDGFDCSGFIYHIFSKYGMELPHSSAMLADEGIPVPLENVQRGDLLIFTGTNVADRTPGHVGVVITPPGQDPDFVHASSNGGVKVSSVKGTPYEKRFLQARRVL